MRHKNTVSAFPPLAENLPQKRGGKRVAQRYEPRTAVQIQEKAENLIAYMLERDAQRRREDEEIKRRLRELAGLSQRAHAKGAKSEIAPAQGDFVVR
jgi:triphosphoribosyl-dephospho-CoA synthetase